MAKRALITGITGQDGSYLAELLLAKGYEVHGIIRRASTFNTGRLEGIYQDPHDSGKRLSLHYGDLSDGSALARLLGKIAPEEIYNLAAQSAIGDTRRNTSRPCGSCFSSRKRTITSLPPVRPIQCANLSRWLSVMRD